MADTSDLVKRERLKAAIRAALIDEVHVYELGVTQNPDILVAGCRAVSYADPEDAAEKTAYIVADAILALESAPTMRIEVDDDDITAGRLQALISRDNEIRRLRQALEDVVNPLAAMVRELEPDQKLNGMAYSIANNLGHVQRIAKIALSGDQPQEKNNG